MTTKPSDKPKRVPKLNGRRARLSLPLTPAEYEELRITAAKEQRTAANLALLRYQRGCQL